MRTVSSYLSKLSSMAGSIIVERVKQQIVPIQTRVFESGNIAAGRPPHLGRAYNPEEEASRDPSVRREQYPVFNDQQLQQAQQFVLAAANRLGIPEMQALEDPLSVSYAANEQRHLAMPCHASPWA